MQGLARFSLVAVIVLAAILLGSWAYLVARYGGVSEYLASEDAPHYWQPSHSAAHDDLDADENACGSLAERVAGQVKSGTPHPEEEGDWRRVKPEQTPARSTPDSPTPADTLEARIDQDYAELAIETEDGTMTAAQRGYSLKPFFARTRPSPAGLRIGYTDPKAYALMTKSGGAKSEALQATEEAGIMIVHGKVVDDQKRKGIANVVVAPILSATKEPGALRAVTNNDGEFLLYIPKENAKEFNCTDHTARLALIGDGLCADGRKLDVVSKADSNGFHEIRLERSRGLRVRVRVTNPKPTEDRVRVWCELRDESWGPCYDDNIFMSIDLPKSGEVVFRMPRGHCGKVRVGASGNGWASEVFETDKFTKDIVTTMLTLNSANTHYVRGVACETWSSDGKCGAGVYAARILSAAGEDLTYTNENGQFEFSVQVSGTKIPALRVSTINGFMREVELAALSRDGEEHSLIRAVPVAGTYTNDWQILIPRDVQTTVVLREPLVIDEKDAKYCYWRFEAPLLGDHERVKETRQRIRITDVTALEFAVPSLVWGSSTLILECANRSAKAKYEEFRILARYQVSPLEWEEAEVTVVSSASPNGPCVVKLELHPKID